MKPIIFTIATLFLASAAYSQCSVLITNHTNTSCNGVCDGSVQLTTVGTPPYSYSWAPGGQTVQNPSDLCAGTHTVTMTDASSCQSTATVTITEPAVLSTTASSSNVSCNGACDGQAFVADTGGTAPYTHAWTPGGQTTNLCPGTYTVTTTDANGCMDSSMTTVTEPTMLMVTGTSNDASCPTCNDGSATVTATGGTTPYSYSWSPSGGSSPTANGLTPGQYVCCVTDANGCSTCDTIMVNTATGITQLDGIYSVSIYPNPVSDHVNLQIRSPQNAHVRICMTNVTGETVFTEEYDSMNQLDKSYSLSGQPAGIYFMEVEINNSRMIRKVMKY